MWLCVSFYNGQCLHDSIERVTEFAYKIRSAINIFAVKWYGEAEFWLASGKILLILIVFCFTFITMVGGNPQKDACECATAENISTY